MQNKEFLNYLIQKLKTGNRASIHLNALPSNYITRLDLNRLNILKSEEDNCRFSIDGDQSLLGDEFLYELLNKASFNFNINLWDLSLQNLPEEQKKQVKYLTKRLDSTYYQTVDNYLEYGLKTFGFGYPLLIKRDRKDKNKIIKAPLLIWKLEIEKSKKRPNSWTIKKEDDFPIAVNEILVSQIYNDDSIKLEEIPREYLEDSIIQKEELLSLCNTFLNQINRTTSTDELLKLERCPSAQKVLEINKAEAYIQWSGVFGTYKNQKQSLIKEVEELAENYENFKFNKPTKLKFDSKLSGVDTDPSQEKIVNTFEDTPVKIIQGPPGTGKSQTISAIITNALENQKKCLVICEKKTAIEVIYNNLEKLGIGSLCGVIDDINKDRARIIQLARSKMEVGKIKKFPSHLYKRNLKKYEKLKKQINSKISLLKKPCFGDYNHKELVGLYLENQMIISSEPLASKIVPDEYQFSYNEFEDLLEIIVKAKKVSENAKADKSGLNIIKDEIYLAKPSEKERHDMLSQLEDWQKAFVRLKIALDKFEEISEDSYDKKAFFQNLGSSTMSLFDKKTRRIHQQKKEIWKAYIQVNSKYQFIDFLNIQLSDYDKFNYYSDINKYITPLKQNIEKCIVDFKGFWHFQEWKRHFYALPKKVKDIVDALGNIPYEKWEAAYKSWYFDQSLTNIFYRDNLEEVYEDILELTELNLQLKKLQQNRIVNQWQKKQQESVQLFQEQTGNGNIKRLYNFRKNKEFGRKNALRKIIAADFELFSNFFPVVLTNPVACSSVLPLKSDLFDIVIFDEASQLRIEDTYTSYLRGTYKVISGDRHQMPPSSYFQSGQTITIEGELTEEIEESAFMAESESLLEFAEENTIKQTYLDFHYRSRHPWLIDFSNAAFYGSRLIPMPAVKEYKPIHFRAVDGLYSESTNIIEANEVVNIIANEIEPFDNGEMPSVGVATTNIAQRNLIWDLIAARSYNDHQFSRKFARLNANGFFVKNLENIQGDERDILIMSTTFGHDEEGNFRQNFGPINQANGYRLLNVIITRAKHQVYVCSSIPPSVFSNYRKLIEEKGNNGRGIFYAYLAYAHAIEQMNETERQNILAFVASHCKESSLSSKSSHVAGPFEQALKNRLSQSIDNERIKSVFQFGGFHLDTVVLANQSDKKNIALECNGGQDLEEDEAYIHLQYRKKLLESYGYDYIYLWSLSFWKDPEGSFKKLQQLIQQ